VVVCLVVKGTSLPKCGTWGIGQWYNTPNFFIELLFLPMVDSNAYGCQPTSVTYLSSHDNITVNFSNYSSEGFATLQTVNGSSYRFTYISTNYPPGSVLSEIMSVSVPGEKTVFNYDSKGRLANYVEDHDTINILYQDPSHPMFPTYIGTKLPRTYQWKSENNLISQITLTISDFHNETIDLFYVGQTNSLSSFCSSIQTSCVNFTYNSNNQIQMMGFPGQSPYYIYEYDSQGENIVKITDIGHDMNLTRILSY